MSSWFCSALCFSENQKMNQIVLANNQTQTTYQYGKSIQRNKSIALQNGFIMLKKSLYDQYLSNCIKNKKNFIDQQFLPNQKSISENNLDQFPQLKNKTIIWKRIPQLYKNCQLIKQRIEPSDIQQGNIGDCYFLSAISALAENQNNILQIFQKKNPKSMIKSQVGIYKLVINVAGQPQELIVDDYIPVYAKSQRPVFCKPVNNQFWVVLLEKAWAKINKSYKNIAYGNPHQVLNRFSVAPVFYYNIPINFYQPERINSKQINEFQQNLWKQIKQGNTQNFPMCCGSRQIVISQGIKPSHSYTLLGAYQIFNSDKKVRLLKLRNPWGHTQYVGKYSENDIFWESINSKIKNQIFNKKQNDGIFVIPFADFLQNFESIDISHCKPSYNYVFKQLLLNQSEPSFYKVTVERQGQVYMTFERNLIRNFSKNQYENSGVSKILIAEQVQNGRYQYVDCGLETYLADSTVRCNRLKAGSYIVLISNQDNKSPQQYSFLSKSNKKGTLSTYSNSLCTIEQIPEVKNYTSQFFYTHAVKYNKQKKSIGAYEGDWIAKKLIQSSGYGYICISLDRRGSKKFAILIKQNEILNEGFKLELSPQSIKCVKNFDQAQIQLQIQPGQVLVFLFKIDFKRQNLTFSFPPPGFDIKRII